MSNEKDIAECVDIALLFMDNFYSKVGGTLGVKKLRLEGFYYDGSFCYLDLSYITDESVPYPIRSFKRFIFNSCRNLVKMTDLDEDRTLL